MPCNLCGMVNVHGSDCPAMFAVPANFGRPSPAMMDFHDVSSKIMDEVQDKYRAQVAQAYKDGQWAGAVERDKVYAERNKLVCALSKLWPAHLAQHPASDTSWDPNWRNIVCIHSPVGQLCWHIMDSELPMFEHLALKANDWDGHTTEQKYERLASWQSQEK